jgi:hypothetical protein
MVLNELNFGDTMEAWVQRLEAMPLVRDSSGPDRMSSWTYLISTMSALVKWWKVKIEPRITASVIQSDTDVADGHSFTNNLYSQNGQFDQPFMDFPSGDIDSYGDTWIRDLFVGSYEL